VSGPDEAQLSCQPDESFPTVYVNPALVDKYHVPRSDDAAFVPVTTSHIVGSYETVTPHTISPSSVSSVNTSDLSDPLNRGSRSSSGSWHRDLVKVESPEDLAFFEFSQTQECVDTYLIDADGLHTYDSLEFQTLREHNLEYSHSHHSL